jgi:DNA-binding transcriptional LysR family regulator
MHNLNWSDLQAFLQVQSDGSVLRAAQTLGLNHSTVLRRIASLEDALAARLFDRLPTGYVATAAGEALTRQLGGVSDQIGAATRQLKGADQGISGVLRLTSTDTLFHGLLMPYLQEFLELHPTLQLQMVINNSFMSLTKREADVAVRGSNHPPEHLIGRRAGYIQTAPYASKAYLEQHGRTTHWEQYRWVGVDESLAHLEQAKWLAANVPSEQVVARTDSLVGMVGCVRQGMGAAMLLCPLADQHAELVRLNHPLPSLDTQVWILTHPDLKRVARVKALVDFLYVRLRSDPGLVTS